MTFDYKQQAIDLENHVRSTAISPTEQLTLPIQNLPIRIKSFLNESYANQTEVQLRLEQEYLHEGPLTPLLEDPSITEIIINNPDDIIFEKNGQLHQLKDKFLTPVSFRNFFMQLCSESHILTNLEHPFADGRWRGFRVHVADRPCSTGNPVICLRRTNIKPWTLATLEDAGWCDSAQKAFLDYIFAEDCNGLIIGRTGSGKTSILNAYLQALPEKRRTVLIEDSAELICPNVLSTRLLTRRDPQGVLPNITQQDLVQQSLRMRPDSLIMGEVRGPEAKDLLMCLATGHTQSWSTLHADTPRQALLRLEMLIQLGAPQWSLHAVRQLIYLSLKYIVLVERTNGGHRQLKGISKIVSVEHDGILIEDLFTH